MTLNANGVTDDALNGTVSADSDDELLVIDDHQDDQDELFPELTYDDTSDVECFEPPTPENAPSRSLTRRSQVPWYLFLCCVESLGFGGHCSWLGFGKLFFFYCYVVRLPFRSVL